MASDPKKELGALEGAEHSGDLHPTFLTFSAANGPILSDYESMILVMYDQKE